jgi:hypothetical protein
MITVQWLIYELWKAKAYGPTLIKLKIFGQRNSSILSWTKFFSAKIAFIMSHISYTFIKLCFIYISFSVY